MTSTTPLSTAVESDSNHGELEERSKKTQNSAVLAEEHSQPLLPNLPKESIEDEILSRLPVKSVAIQERF